MKRMTVLVLLAGALLSSAAWGRGRSLENKYGTISISDSGIVSKGSELVACGGLQSRPGNSLGSLNFMTGVLTSGGIETGGTFSSTDSSFTVIGRCKEGQREGVIFQGSFEGVIAWTLVSQMGEKLTFVLSGFVKGTNRKGNKVHASMTQIIVTTRAQLAKGIGHISIGTVEYPT